MECHRACRATRSSRSTGSTRTPGNIRGRSAVSLGVYSGKLGLGQQRRPRCRDRYLQQQQQHSQHCRAFVASDGTNISGQPIPGTGGAFNYPGQTGSTTVALAPQNTMVLTYSTGQGTRAGNSALLATVIVTSDQPVVVGYNVPFGALISAPCALSPR